MDDLVGDLFGYLVAGIVLLISVGIPALIGITIVALPTTLYLTCRKDVYFRGYTIFTKIIYGLHLTSIVTCFSLYLFSREDSQFTVFLFGLAAAIFGFFSWILISNDS